MVSVKNNQRELSQQEVYDLSSEILHRSTLVREEATHAGQGITSNATVIGDKVVLIAQQAEERAYENYRMQKWCAKRAHNAGVSTAPIFEVGNSPRPYAILPLIKGENGDDLLERMKSTLYEGELAAFEKRLDIMTKLGRNAQIINSIPTQGFGSLVRDERSQRRYRGEYQSWEQQLRSTLQSSALFTGPSEKREQLMQLGGLDPHVLKQAQALFDEAAQWKVESVLCHRDLRPANTICNEQDIVIIDWGFAEAGIGVVSELSSFMMNGNARPSKLDAEAFLDGYQIPHQAWAETTRRAHVFLMIQDLRCGEECFDGGNEVWATKWMTRLKEDVDQGSL